MLAARIANAVQEEVSGGGGVDAVLRSNRGVSELTLRLNPRGGAVWECTLVFVGEDWNSARGHPFTTTVEGFLLTTAALAALHRHLLSWLDGPLEALVSSRLDAVFELAVPGQGLCFRFGSVDGVIAELGKPAVSVRISIGALAGSFHLVADPSCIGLFAGELGHVLHLVEK